MKKKITLKSINLPNGETLAYRTVGNCGKTLLLVHGNMNSSVNWDLLMENLPEDYTIYAVDQRGFGDSTYKNPISSIRDVSDDIKLFANALGLENFVLAGWSQGGAVAMQFVIDYPGYAEKLILLAPCCIKGFPVIKRDASGQPIWGELVKTKEEVKAMFGPVQAAVSSKMIPVLRNMCDLSLFRVNKPAEERYAVYLEEMTKQRNLVDTNFSLINFNISHEHNGVVPGTGEVDKITLPTLVLQGDQDVLVLPEMSRITAEGIGENAKLVTLPGCGHVPLVDNLELLVKEFRSFIEE